MPISAWVFGGAAALGLATFGTFAILGFSQEKRLASRCAPRCNDNEVSSVARSYLVADVGAAVAAVCAVAAVIIGWPHRSHNVAAVPTGTF
jgi:hypothetical protein